MNFRYDFYEKAVTFKPYQVDMLDPVTANFLGDNLRCWMQIQVTFNSIPKVQCHFMGIQIFSAGWKRPLCQWGERHCQDRTDHDHGSRCEGWWEQVWHDGECDCGNVHVWLLMMIMSRWGTVSPTMARGPPSSWWTRRAAWSGRRSWVPSRRSRTLTPQLMSFSMPTSRFEKISMPSPGLKCVACTNSRIWPFFTFDHIQQQFLIFKKSTGWGKYIFSGLQVPRLDERPLPVRGAGVSVPVPRAAVWQCSATPALY